MPHRKYEDIEREIEKEVLDCEDELPFDDYCERCKYPRTDCVCTDAELEEHARDFYSNEE